ncbi:LLM class flavin-dependent oxidoreductase [Homoserinibacter sp. YIM 151385]|uniref:LLM class flavin-dependent oxidoreductase n=1 Tax=Homoserinibacter sp. YIM 151385 TaxID=2985506 RepID=UPI0022F070F2|nr:LLM class flavin-dependent oxidoreductase [Homoserinibacter sp. YIM 151385]WBU38216.1 LLM class flavin-dependent oxidoreductase [Homoserinibacter sp. YIM 151385]
MTRMQHLGWFFSRGFGPQGWKRPSQRWDWRWTDPAIYQQAVRELEQAGLDLVIAEDAISLGTEETLDVRIREAYGGPKLDPLLLAPYLFQATRSIGVAPTVNAGITPPYLAARQAATLHHLSRGRFGLNVVTDVKSARHVGLPELAHDAAYERAEEWTSLLRRLWRSWGDGALVEDAETGRYADASRLDAFRHEGEHFRVAGPLNAPPFGDLGEPAIVSPGGSGPGLAFAGRNSDVQLALSPLDVDSIRAYRARIHEAAREHGRSAAGIRILFVVKPELVSSPEEADRLVRASASPDDAAIADILAGQSSDLETDLTVLDWDRPLDPAIFGDHVSQGTIRGLRGPYERFEDATLRELAAAKARRRRLPDGGTVGTAEELADVLEALGDDADNDGIILSGDLHPVTVHRMLDELVPVLRRRGVLRTEYGDGGIRANLFDF